MNRNPSEILDLSLSDMSADLLDILLVDRTLTSGSNTVNIFWATDNYDEMGDGYKYNDKITRNSLFNASHPVVVPRSMKSQQKQKLRIKKMAEVFTPAWVCNAMNNIVDENWFGRKNVFNTEINNTDGTSYWVVNEEKIRFPHDKHWQKYVKDNILEITCGEAPFLASRYDSVSGEEIPVERRIGILDRKLRVVRENTSSENEWLDWALYALKATYGYEWQGDSLLLARISLLCSMNDHFYYVFHKNLNHDFLMQCAEIISWNIWQMDGLKFVIPNSCHKVPQAAQPKKKHQLQIGDMFSDDELVESTQVLMQDCPGCKNKDYFTHNGIYTKIMDWEVGEPVTFVSILKKNKENGYKF